MANVSSAKALEIYSPTQEDLARARQLSPDSCPRRHCWWWHSLLFDWEIEPSIGCTFLLSKKPPGWPHPEICCKRSDRESDVDQYEPREPHMEDDGFDVRHWQAK
jgi:hypothetical protein